MNHSDPTELNNFFQGSRSPSVIYENTFFGRVNSLYFYHIEQHGGGNGFERKPLCGFAGAFFHKNPLNPLSPPLKLNPQKYPFPPLLFTYITRRAITDGILLHGHFCGFTNSIFSGSTPDRGIGEDFVPGHFRYSTTIPVIHHGMGGVKSSIKPFLDKIHYILTVPTYAYLNLGYHCGINRLNSHDENSQIVFHTSVSPILFTFYVTHCGANGLKTFFTNATNLSTQKPYAVRASTHYSCPVWSYMVLCGEVRYGAVGFGMVRYGGVWLGTVGFGTAG